VGYAPAHLLQELELLLVGVVERLPRVLVLVEGPGRLRLEDVGEPLHQAHRSRSRGFVPVFGQVHPAYDDPVGRVAGYPPCWSTWSMRAGSPRGAGAGGRGGRGAPG